MRLALLGVINTTIYPNRLVVSSYGAVRDRVVSWRRGAGTGYLIGAHAVQTLLNNVQLARSGGRLGSCHPVRRDFDKHHACDTCGWNRSRGQAGRAFRRGVGRVTRGWSARCREGPGTLDGGDRGGRGGR